MGADILIIEDNAENLELMSYLLGAFGHAVRSAIDGRQGVEAARSRPPDLIICDVHMPVMSGYEVARWLKSDSVLRKTPLVAVTALAMVGDRDKILAAGFDGYVTKPIDPETFVRQIEMFLSSRLHTGAPSSSGVSAPLLKSEPGQGPVVLVVDNLPVNLELARSILEPSGYTVITAETMNEGLAVARRFPCDLILSDVCMSGGTGFEFLQAIKDDPRLRGIPFVLITSTMVEQKDRAKGLALGAARFLVRPIEPDLFLAQIAQCIPSSSRPVQ